jgi:uncharacterized protein YbaP (TraB family)
MVWRFKSKDQEVDHFLIGTMHVGCTASYTYASIAKRAIDLSDVYLAEMDLAAAAASDIRAAYMLPGDTTLHDYLSRRHFDRLAHMLDKSFGLSIDHYVRLRPLLLLNQLASKILQEGTLSPLDHYLWEYASGADRRLGGLETVEEQRDLLLDIDLSIQVRQLKNALRNVRYFRKVTKKTAQLYAIGRYQQLYQTTAKSMGSLRHTLIHSRNNTMTERLLTSIDSQPDIAHAVALGAGHIGGSSGLRAGLLRAGYTVTPVKKHIS